MEELWSFNQKKNFILQRMYNEVGITGQNKVWIQPSAVTTGESDFDQTLLYRKEYDHILEILEFENLLRVIEKSSERGFHIELLERVNSQKSMYVQDGYETVRDVMFNADLRESLLGILLRAYGVYDPREIDRKRSKRVDVDERWNGSYQDEKILLLEHLGIAKADWDALKKQTHRPFGSRLINVYFDGEKVGDFLDVFMGRKSLIEKRVLKLIAERLTKTRLDAEAGFWSDFFVEQGIPSSLFPTDYNLPIHDFIYGVLVVLASTGDERDRRLLEKILTETTHPLFYKGDEMAANKCEQELNKLLKFSNLVLREGQLISTSTEPPREQPVAPIKPTIKAKAIEQLSWLIKDMMTEYQLRDLFSNVGVSGSIIPTDAGSKQRLVYGVLNALSISADEGDKALLFRILEEVGHPLYSGNDMTRAKETQINITKMIRYDGLSVIGDFMHPFNEKDKAAITAFEEDRKKVDPALAESLSGFFGGNIFESSFAPPRVKKQDASQTVAAPQPTPQQEARAMHVHIHNDHKITQSIQIPMADQEIEHVRAQAEAKKSLKDVTITFNDDLTSVVIDGKNCKLPPHKNEHLFCRAAFEYKKGEPIDWSIISEKMTGKQWGESGDEGAKKDKRAVMDTMYAINKRIADVFNTEDQLFVWSEKTVTRMF